jgi:hypothetical protein
LGADSWLSRLLEDFTGEGPSNEAGLPRPLLELETAAAKARKQVISAPRKVLWLPLIGNDRASLPSDAPKSSIANVFRPVLAMASAKGWPVCLEATSPRARDIYEYLGFKVIEEIYVGVGRVGRDGRRIDGGPGIAMWAMAFGV